MSGVAGFAKRLGDVPAVLVAGDGDESLAWAG